MQKTWTHEQITALAPDDASIKAANKLTALNKWGNLGKNDKALWGECKGSGKNPYQTCVDLDQIAFKCSCPSRKFPCKHSLALLFLLVDKSKEFQQAIPPQWVTQWLLARAKRAEQKTEKATVKTNAQTTKKSSEERQKKVTAGLQELELWLYDLVRQGMATLQGKPFSFWDNMAARMVDAQASGLARMLREMSSLPSSGTNWSERLLEKVSLLYLLIESYKHLDNLPAEMVAEIRSLIGWTQNQQELLTQAGIFDTWLVLGHYITEEERLKTQHMWLWGKGSNQYALVLDFAYGNKPFGTNLRQGMSYEAELVLFSGLAPRRALIKSHSKGKRYKDFAGFADLDNATASYARALSKNPWISRFPMSLDNIKPIYHEDYFWLQDTAKRTLPLHSEFDRGWEILSLSGGNPIKVFGQWDGETFLPLSTQVNKKVVKLYG